MPKFTPSKESCSIKWISWERVYLFHHQKIWKTSFTVFSCKYVSHAETKINLRTMKNTDYLGAKNGMA